MDDMQFLALIAGIIAYLLGLTIWVSLLSTTKEPDPKEFEKERQKIRENYEAELKKITAKGVKDKTSFIAKFAITECFNN